MKMKMTKTISWVLALSTLVAVVPMSANADREDNRGRQVDRDRHDDSRAWHGDIRHFNDRDLAHWRTGQWHHDYYDGRLGWWWVVAGLWYFYPQRVAGYPDPYTPPPVVVVQPTAPAAPSAPPPSQYWYYCDAAKGYYPYVPSCPAGWRMVPASPLGAPGQ
jgi:hypothetical protein